MLEPNLLHFQHQPPPPPPQQPLILTGRGSHSEEDGFDDDEEEISKNDAGSPISSYSSSSSVSSFSSVNSGVLFNRKGSLASILNSDPELLALEREERLGGYQAYFNANNDGVDVNNNNNSNNASLADHKKDNIKKRNAPEPTTLVDPKRPRRSSPPQDRQVKGLRLFSKQVCNKVAEKGITTYNEVADELAADIQRNSASYDQKNIRRRVYDALNVFMALDIITKDRKEIKWLGLNNDKSFLEEQIQQEESRQRELSKGIADAKSKLDDTFKQYLCLEKVVQRNTRATPSPSKVISFPFFVVSSDNSTSSITRMSNHESCLSFTENASMMIYRDLEILSHIWRT
ncbi:hypothetical protein K501DRAFT_283947 [Backusella circina FSU 941]|nr:hypothetical protein K501DRAFT_283947 [Backusella circina FSU 941]